MTVCLILKVKKFEFLRGLLMSPRTVPAFRKGYLAIPRDINARKNRKMHERLVEVFLRQNISAVRKIPVCDFGNELLQNPVSSHCLQSFIVASSVDLCCAHFPFPSCFILQWKWSIGYMLMCWWLSKCRDFSRNIISETLGNTRQLFCFIYFF